MVSEKRDAVFISAANTSQLLSSDFVSRPKESDTDLTLKKCTTIVIVKGKMSKCACLAF